jgi:hypothetical protein
MMKATNTTLAAVWACAEDTTPTTALIARGIAVDSDVWKLTPFNALAPRAALKQADGDLQ